MKLSKTGRYIAWLCAVTMGTVWWLTSAYMSLATFSYFCLIIGIAERKKKKFHMSLMLTGIISDITTVLVLEVTRAATSTASSGDLTVTQYVHIICSLSAILIYLPTIFLGLRRALQASPSQTLKKSHILFGLTAFALRTIGWFTMFSFFDYSAQ